VDGCCTAAEVGRKLATLDNEVGRASDWDTHEYKEYLERTWQQTFREHTPYVLEKALQHPYGFSLMAEMKPHELQTAVDISSELMAPAPDSATYFCVLTSRQARLAAFIACLLTTDQAESGSSSNINNNSSGSNNISTSSNNRSNNSSNSDNTNNISASEAEVQLACIAVTARAVHLLGTVLDTALSNLCLYKSSSAEACAARTEQLTRQLEISKAAGTLTPLPEFVQHELNKKNSRQFMGSVKGSSAVVGALLGDCWGNKQLGEVELNLWGFKDKLKKLQGGA
jgi:hypothetical protein